MGLKIDPLSGGAIVIDKCRKKYGARFGFDCRPWERLRMFYEFREKDLKFCQDALAKSASTRPPFNLELGELFQTSLRFARQAIVWKLSQPPALLELYQELRDQFIPIIKDIERDMAKGSRFLGPKDFEGRRGEQHWALGLYFRPIVKITRAPSIVEAHHALKEIESEYGNRFWTVRVVGLSLGFKMVDRNQTPEYQEFPFRGSE